jgi:hypothetical protein
VTVHDAESVTATFVTMAPLTVSRRNAGSVTSADGSIACGNRCSTSVAQGSIVTLTATPDAGRAFVDWSGDCRGPAPTCSLTVGSGGAKAQANFTR